MRGHEITITGALNRASGEAVGTYAIQQGTLALNANYDLTYVGANLTITKASLTVTPTNISVPYSEPTPLPLEVTYSGFKFTDEASVIDTPPTCSTTRLQFSAPGTYPITCSSGADNNYTFSYVNGKLTVIGDTATVTCTSFGWYSTLSPTDKNFRVLLSATVGDPDGLGDVRNATVTFMEGSNVLCTSTVGLVDPLNTTVGAASCYWTGALGSLTSPTTYEVTVVVGGYYSGTTKDPTPVRISPASITNFITCGGHLVLTNSSGATPGEMNSKMNFGFTIKYNKSGTNPQGKVPVILRAAYGHHYQIKSTAIDSLSVTPVNLINKTTGTGIFTAKCNITDLSNGHSISGQYTL
jgi:hypothetical protein